MDGCQDVRENPGLRSMGEWAVSSDESLALADRALERVPRKDLGQASFELLELLRVCPVVANCDLWSGWSGQWMDRTGEIDQVRLAS